MPLTRRKRDKDRDGRERWEGRSSFTSVHVSYLWHQCSDATAEKSHSNFYFTCMYVPSLYNPRWDSIVWSGEWNLQGGSCCFPTLCRTKKKKKKKMFSNAARSNSFGQVSVPQLPISVSFITEREQEQRELSLSLCQTLSLNYSLSLLPVAFESACPFIEDFF